MISRYFIPDVFFENIYEITPEFLKKAGIKALVLDIDNTLVTYDDPKPTEPVLNWFRQMKEAGISMALVSNNNHKRVALFNEDLGFFARGFGNKPSRKYVRRAMVHMGVTADETALIGDQILTDILAAKRAKLKKALLVRPINDKKGIFTKAKRIIEKPFMRKYEKLNGGKK